MRTKAKARDINLDGILEEIGEMGRYQVAHYVLLSIIVILTSSSYLSYIFTAGQLDYRCQIRECDSAAALVSGSAEYRPKWLPLAIPYDADGTPSRCRRFAYIGDRVDSDDHQSSVAATDYRCDESSFNKSLETQCDAFVFDSDEVTIVNAFNVTCEENEWRLAVIGTLGYIAELIVLPICAVLSDRYGRRPILIATLLLSGISGIIKSFSTSYAMFAIMEFVTSLVSGGTYMTIFVMAIEFSGPSKRVFSGTLISAIYSSSQVLAGILAMNFHNFRVFLQVLFVPNFLVLTFIWLVPESVRWLVTKGKLRRARQILMRAAKLNGVEISQHNKDMLYEQHEIKIVTGSHTIASAATTNTSVGSLESEPPTSSFRFAFQSSSLILRLLNCLFCWLANSFIYYGMNINSVSLAGNKYVNYIFVNLVEVPAVYLASYLMEKFGRKKVLCICLLINGVACVATEFIAKDDHVGRLTMYIIGKCGVTISFTVLYVFSSELFPTSIRHSFMNACSSAGSVGSIIAPFTPLLANTWSALPLLMFGGSALTAGLLVLLLPETLNTQLPDTVEEAVDIGNVHSDDEKDACIN